MARRKARIPQGKKIQPAVKTLTFQFTNGGAPGRFDFIDLSQCASIVNRRFYRQGLNWAVAGFTLITSPGTSGNFVISKVPDTWVASNAWMKGFAAWQNMNNEALAESESVRPKFLDFKVYMNERHFDSGVVNNLLPLDALAQPFAPGEWDYSEYVVPFGPASPGNTSNFAIKWTGANYNGGTDAVVSLIEGYAASRGLPYSEDPNTPSDASDADGSTPENWLSALQNEGTDQASEVLGDMITENNQAPYPYEGDGTFTDTMYPGGANQGPDLEIHDYAGVSATTIGNVTKLSGSNFQGGLIQISNDFAGGESEHLLLVHLVPGTHRGYMCQKMQDV